MNARIVFLASVVANLVFAYSALQDPEISTFVLWTYWCHSVILGVVHAIRFAVCGSVDLGTKNVEHWNPKYTRVLTIFLAAFFVVHYGLFHFGYALFIQGQADYQKVLMSTSAWFVIGGFGLQEILVGIRNIMEDRHTPVVIETEYIEPYKRIVPIHFAILLTASNTSSVSAGVLLVIFVSGMDIFSHFRDLRAEQAATAV